MGTRPVVTKRQLLKESLLSRDLSSHEAKALKTRCLAASGQFLLARLGGRSVAALRMLEDHRATYVHTMHFGQSLREFAPGLVIFEAMMRDAFARGIGRVDFYGSSHFFSRWATGRFAHGSLRIYRHTLRGRFGRVARGLVAGRRREKPVAKTAT